jgi:leucyl aminopeptidase (aminopeptidase T)
MNERIKDLLEEAGLVSYGEDMGFYNIPAPAFLSRIDRLAELIVKECVKLQYKNVVVGGVSDYNRGRRELAEEILKHFGVEE